MLKRTLMTVCALAVSSAICTAQARPAQTTTPAKPAADTTTKPEPAAAQKAAPEPAPLPINIKIEVSITDQTGTNTHAKKVVTMIASDRMSTNVRSSASVPVKTTVFAKPPRATESDPANIPTASYTYRNVTINVDARPAIVQKEPEKIRLSFGRE